MSSCPEDDAALEAAFEADLAERGLEPLSYETVRYIWRARQGQLGVPWSDLYRKMQGNPRLQQYVWDGRLEAHGEASPAHVRRVDLRAGDEPSLAWWLADDSSLARWLEECRTHKGAEGACAPPDMTSILVSQEAFLEELRSDCAEFEDREASRPEEWSALDTWRDSQPAICPEVQQRVSWGLPTGEFLEKAAAFVGADGFVLGVGSGHGYLEFCIGRWARAEVRCTDKLGPSPHRKAPWASLGPVEALDAEAALARYGAKATVLVLAFPPVEEAWTARAVRCWREEHRGRSLLLVMQTSVAGSPQTGSRELQSELRAHWCIPDAAPIEFAGPGMETEALFCRVRGA